MQRPLEAADLLVGIFAQMHAGRYSASAVCSQAYDT